MKARKMKEERKTERLLKRSEIIAHNESVWKRGGDISTFVASQVRDEMPVIIKLVNKIRSKFDNDFSILCFHMNFWVCRRHNRIYWMLYWFENFLREQMEWKKS